MQIFGLTIYWNRIICLNRIVNRVFLSIKIVSNQNTNDFATYSTISKTSQFSTKLGIAQN